MWARHAEVMLGLWLAISGFVFSIPASERAMWALELSLAGPIMVLALSCYWSPMRRAHLALLPIALGLILVAFVQPRPLPSWQQNHLLVGLLLAMFAVVPSHAGDPPSSWQT